MIDLRQVREEEALVREGLARRGNPELLLMLDRILHLDADRRDLISKVDALRARRNEASPRVAELKRAGAHEEADALIREMREVGEETAEREAELSAVEEEVRGLLLHLPNLPLPEVPPGGVESNVVLREWGEARHFDFTPKPHWELGESLGVLDLPRGAKVAGSGFPLYIGLGARLERALINFMVDLHAREHGYTEVWPPYLVNHQTAQGTGQLPKFGEDMYEVPLDGLYLIPTAEVPVTNMHAAELLDGGTLPIQYVAYSPCFRREAGAHGKETRGLTRVHQFDKVELVRFEKPEASAAALEELTGHAEKVLQLLGLRYRVLLLAGGDLGFASAKTYDLEVWAPGAERWLEVSSCSIFTDYQARRAGIRYRADGGRPQFVHTLNGSALALARTVIALLESHQEADGTIRLPEALVPYFGQEYITR
jgi:seryl-tRNA synthetase